MNVQGASHNPFCVCTAPGAPQEYGWEGEYFEVVRIGAKLNGTFTPPMIEISIKSALFLGSVNSAVLNGPSVIAQPLVSHCVSLNSLPSCCAVEKPRLPDQTMSASFLTEENTREDDFPAGKRKVPVDGGGMFQKQMAVSGKRQKAPAMQSLSEAHLVKLGGEKGAEPGTRLSQ